MRIGTELALVGLSDIVHPARPAEIAGFAGNAIELSGTRSRFLALSAAALASLRQAYREPITALLPMIALDVPTIELGGGSMRCIIAGIHLTPRSAGKPT